MLRFLTFSGCVFSLSIITGAIAQVGGPAIPPGLKEKLGPGLSTPPQLAQQVPGVAGQQLHSKTSSASPALEACQNVIATEAKVILSAVQNSYATLAIRQNNWQFIIDRTEPPAKLEDVIKFAESLGVNTTKMKEAKDLPALKAIAIAEKDAIKPDEIITASKARIDTICKAILGQVTAGKSIAEKQAEFELVEAKNRLDMEVCERKQRLVGPYLQQVYAMKLPKGIGPEPLQDPEELEIISARYGERMEGPTCDAWSYLHKKCVEGREGTKKTLGVSGMTYCMIERATPAAKDEFCGYDPAPKWEKHLIIRYACGGREMRPMVLPGESRHIRLICQYPEPSPSDKLAETKKFLVAEPCKVTGLE